MESKKPRHFPDAFAREAVDRVRTSGLTILQVAEELGVAETVLRRYIRRFDPLQTRPARRPITQAQGREVREPRHGGFGPQAPGLDIVQMAHRRQERALHARKPSRETVPRRASPTQRSAPPMARGAATAPCPSRAAIPACAQRTVSAGSSP